MDEQLDSTSQYDAIRAYLKELDITNSVWIGLQRKNNKPEFSWTDYEPLSNNDHWQEAIPKGGDPLCVAMDPAADFRWHAMSCGGPSMASFICELPVPTWATGPKGCLLTELPSLTVLYIPEQSALELTSDCGLDGTKRIACKGNASHDEMVKQLACTINNEDFEERTTRPATTIPSSGTTLNENAIKTTRPWFFSNTVDTSDYASPTRHRRHTDTVISTSTASSINTSHNPEKQKVLTTVNLTQIATSMAEKIESMPSEMTYITNNEEVRSSEAPEVTSIDANPNYYPSSINQGQIFSIIENGTIFDIIELNETGTEENKEKITTIPNVSESSKETTTSKPLEVIDTTLIHIKEAMEESMTLTSQDSPDMKPTKKSFSPENSKHLLGGDGDKSINKEVEMFSPIAGDPMITLNRTNRKQLPMIGDFDENVEVDLDLDNKLSMEKEKKQHKTVEIKLHKPGSDNQTNSVIFITTKIAEKNKKKPYDPKEKCDDNKEQEIIFKVAKIQKQTLKVEKHKKSEKGTMENIDHKIDDIFKNKEEENSPKFEEMSLKYDQTTTKPDIGNQGANEDKSKYTISIDDMISTTEKTTSTNNLNKDLELIIVEYNKSEDGQIIKDQYLSKSLREEGYSSSSEKTLVESDIEDNKDNIEGTGDPLYTEPQEPPRPNRQRQLTKSQRKTFYPYFFSRMLG